MLNILRGISVSVWSETYIMNMYNVIICIRKEMVSPYSTEKTSLWFDKETLSTTHNSCTNTCKYWIFFLFVRRLLCVFCHILFVFNLLYVNWVSPHKCVLFVEHCKIITDIKVLYSAHTCIYQTRYSRRWVYTNFIHSVSLVVSTL